MKNPVIESTIIGTGLAMLYYSTLSIDIKSFYFPSMTTVAMVGANSMWQHWRQKEGVFKVVSNKVFRGDFL